MSDCLYAPYGKSDCGTTCDGINHHYLLLEHQEREKHWLDLNMLYARRDNLHPLVHDFAPNAKKYEVLTKHIARIREKLGIDGGILRESCLECGSDELDSLHSNKN